MSMLATIGSGAIDLFRRLRRLLGVAWAAVRLACLPHSWPRTVRTVFARQILFTGVEAIQFVSVVALLAGISVVVQAQLWIGRLGQAELLGPLLITVIVREVGPLLVNFIVIGRSGTAMAAELAGMTVRNEVKVLDAQGLDPMAYLVMPRAIGMALCVLCLTVIFGIVSLSGGYVFGALMGIGPGDPNVFLQSVVQGIKPEDFYNLLAKTLIPGLLTGVICSAEGLSIEGVATDVPQAVTRSVVRSNTVVIMVSVIVSVLTYI
jgi:phospholipid/cholesterol/gamma-HCH transport system permease protein